MASKVFVVVGGAYGSEGKGAVAGRICADGDRWRQRVVCVRVGGPNAGHTVLGVCPPQCAETEQHWNGSRPAHPWRLRQVPVAAVTAPTADLVIAAGSEVSPRVLEEELRDLDAAGYNASGRLRVDRSATVLTDAHQTMEGVAQLNAVLGSTAKGIGAARSERIWRRADTWSAEPEYGGIRRLGFDTADWLADRLDDGESWIVVEGTQGYGLGLHTDNYPYTTSGDCRAIDFLAQAGISPWRIDQRDLKVVVCMRPHPIRVAGNSGPMLGETSWDELGLPVEYTTVTQKVRRVGGWDPELAIDAFRANGGDTGWRRRGVVWVALTMMDSVEPELAGMDAGREGWRSDTVPGSALRLLHSIDLHSGHLAYVGTGPDTALVNQEVYR